MVTNNTLSRHVSCLDRADIRRPVYIRKYEIRADMEAVTSLLQKINDLIWGVPLLVLILSGGVLLTIRLRGMQIRRLPLALKWMVKNEEDGEGDVSSFGALCTALAATIGTGNIVGVATAIRAGGPGALFWMIVAALFGMATKFAEGVLAIRYRKKAPDGHYVGGPFSYIEYGMGAKWKWLAKLFAFFGIQAGLLGIGTIAQVNGISSAIHGFFDQNDQYLVEIPGIGSYSITIIITAIVVTVCVAFVLLGGIRRISGFSQVIVPFVAGAYVLFCLIVIIRHADVLPAALAEIIVGAFNPAAVTGGLVASMLVAVQLGIARGIFSNEAGLGSAPIAAAAAKTKEPVRQGLVSMTGTFIDTIVICTLTGLTIVVTGAWRIPGLQGVAVTSWAFQTGLPFPSVVSSAFIMLTLSFFAFTTIPGWDYYSERCLEYLSGGKMKAVRIFRIIYIGVVFIGAFLTVEGVWTIANIFNGLMAIPNMIAILALNGVVTKETRRFFST